MRHLAFPLRLDPRGRTALADDEDYLRGLVEQVLFTRPGERVNRPDFGSGVDRLVFAPTDRPTRSPSNRDTTLGRTAGGPACRPTSRSR